MANIILAWPNRIDAFYSATDVLTTPTLSGGSWQLPLTNLQDRLMSTVARSTDATLASTQFSVDLTESRLIQVMAIPKHTLSLAAQIRVRAWAKSGHSTLLFDSGFTDVWTSIWMPEDLEFEYDNWFSGKLMAEELHGYPHVWVYVLPSKVFAQYWTVEISDTTNAAGYIDISRFIMSPGWQPSRNLVYGATLGWETETKVATSLASVDWFDHRPTYRVLTFSLPHLPKQEGYSKAFEMMRLLGTDGEVFVCMNSDDPVNLQRHSFLGRLRKLNPVGFNFINLSSTTWEIKELL